jgi:hypothetical protein
MNKFKLILAAAVVAVPTLVSAQPIQVVRCQTVDSIDIPTARNRIEWARKCSLTLNTGATPRTGNPANFFQSVKAADAATLLGAKEYRESTTAQAFSNTVNDFNINYTRVWSIFGALFAFNVFQDTSGPTLNFFNWTTTAPARTQPFYPSFDSTVSGTGIALFPPPGANINSPCTLFTDPGGVNAWPTANAHFVAFYCAAGCYTADQNVRFSTGDVSIGEAFDAIRDDVVTLSPNASLDHPATQVSRVFSYTRDARDGTQMIWTVKTASGGTLRVTNSHPVLVSRGGSGRMVMAEKLHEGDDLVKADGTLDPIVEIEASEHFGRAYNLAPTSSDLVSNILVAQGFLVGSSRFQNDDLKYMNRALLFRAVPDDIMPQ